MSGGYFTQQVPLSPWSRKVDSLCVWNVISLWESTVIMKVKFTLLQACDCWLFQTGGKKKANSKGMGLGGLSSWYPQSSHVSEGKGGNRRVRSGFCVKAFKRNEWWKMTNHIGFEFHFSSCWDSPWLTKGKLSFGSRYYKRRFTVPLEAQQVAVPLNWKTEQQ